MARRIFELTITLADVDPPVWRRVLVPGGYTLDRLHRVIQYAMGWQDRHLHCFEVDGVQYGEPEPEPEVPGGAKPPAALAPGPVTVDDLYRGRGPVTVDLLGADGEPDTVDELDTRLDAVADKGVRLRYTYDFGDWWEHDLLVDDVGSADPDERYPICVDGSGVCPPEDVGGPAGYGELLAAVFDPFHPGREDWADWLGRPLDPDDFDPDDFDPLRATTLLRRLT